MAMNFPIDPVNRSRREEVATANHELRELGHSLSWQIGSAAPYKEQPSLTPGGGAMSRSQEAVEGPVHGDQLAVIQEHAESDEAASAQSMGKMDPQAPRWTKRVRAGKHPPEMMPCPDRIGALEQTRYADKLGEHKVEPTLGLTFDSLGEACNFYSHYSWEHGFGIRYGKSRQHSMPP